MTYRLYRRHPVVKGNWYIGVTCKSCGEYIYVLEERSEGKSPAKFVGEGLIGIVCNRCNNEDIYKPVDLVPIQSTENIEATYPPRPAVSASSRKPLGKSYPKAKPLFGVGLIEDRPAAAAIIARIITSWADIEVKCASLLAELMGAKIPSVTAVFSALRSSRVQHDALLAAAEISLNESDLELFTAYMARRTSLEKERNDIAHGCFGISVDIPNHLVWVSQLDFAIFSGNGMDLETFRRKQFVYELSTLERLAQEIAEFHHQLDSLIGYLSSRSRGKDSELFRAQRYPQLCNQPHIRQVLDQIQKRKRDAEARS